MRALVEFGVWEEGGQVLEVFKFGEVKGKFGGEGRRRVKS